MSPLLKRSLPELQQFFVRVIPFHRYLGLQMVGCEAGRLQIDLPYKPQLATSADINGIHEAAITALVDTACGSVVLTMVEHIRRSATLDLRLDFLRPAAPGASLRCEAECFGFNDDVAFVRASVHDGVTATPVAVATGTFAVFRGKRDETAVTDALRIVVAADPASDSTAAADGDYRRMLGFEAKVDTDGLLGRLMFADPVVGNPPLGILHGGAVAGLLQLTATAELVRQMGGQAEPRLFNSSIEYLRPNLSTDTWARATLISRSKRFANLRVTAYQQAGSPTAVATAQFLLA